MINQELDADWQKTTRSFKRGTLLPDPIAETAKRNQNIVTKSFNRRQFIATAAIAAGAHRLFAASPAPMPSNGVRGVGVLANGLHYSIGLFRNKNRPGRKLSTLQFVEKVHQCGGTIAKFHESMISSLSDAELKRIRARAEELDVALEIHGGNPLQPSFETVFDQALTLGCTLVGGAFGYFERPNKIASLDAWDTHTRRCRTRLNEVARAAKPLGITIGIENHLDFTTKELLDLITSVKADNVGVVFDVGNSLGTLDDPIEAAEQLGPHIVSVHFKDYAVEETDLGFRLIPAPLGVGSLQLERINQVLQKHVRPGTNFAVGTIIGSHIDVNWLEDRFWDAYRDKSPRDIAAALRHFRSKPFNRKELISSDDYASLSIEERMTLEQNLMKESVAHLRALTA